LKKNEKGATERLRLQALDLLTVSVAHAWIVAPPDRAEIARIEGYRRDIARASRKQLYVIVQSIERKIEEVRNEFSITAEPGYLVQILEAMHNARPGEFTLFPLHFWRSLFRNNQYPWPGLDALPLHARIGLDASGELYTGARHPEVYLLETILYEDAAALFNAAKREIPRPRDKSRIKLHNALCRGSITAAVYFVEAYLNGLAVDYFIENQDQLDNTQRSTLLDWDFARNRPRYLALRDKLLQYQRIILRVEHAPIQESNCEAVKTILGTARVIRDAIAHPSPAFDLETLEAEKERIVFGLTLQQAEEVLDASVALVKRLEHAICGDVRRLSWLYERGPNGLFPDETFA
jgi:hypothetical protein